MNNLLDDLNPAQRQAVKHWGSPLLVLAGAGSGKTRVLTYRAAWLVSQGIAEADQLLLLTFTNKAAGEMKNRLEILLKDLGKRITHFPFSGTFHSFSAFILRREADKIGLPRSFVIYDADDQLSLIKNLIKEFNLDKDRFGPGMIKSVIESAKNRLIDPETFLASAQGSYQEPVALIYQRYQKTLRDSGALDFDDLLIYTIELFRKNPSVLEKYHRNYRYVLVDEYQDTNRIQYSLTKMIAGKKGNLTAVGDAAQAIYSWRGADYRNLMNLTKDFPNIKIINLEQNYRSTQTILDAANSVIAKNEKHPVLKLFTKKGAGDKVLVYRAGSEIDEAEFISEKIKQLVDFGGLDPTKIAVLYRTNAQSRPIEESFIRYGLPYILVGGVKFYDRAEVKDVLSLVRVFYNPKDNISWQRIEKNFGKRRRDAVRAFVEKDTDRDRKTETLLKEILVGSGYLEKYNPKDEDDYRRLENIKELSSVAKQFPDIGQFLENVALVQQEYFAQEKEKNSISDKAVRVMTLHSSKGLEFDAVFLVGLEEGLLPHSRSMEEADQLEEERRLCYVGMTRAKKKLFLSYAKKRLFFGKTNYNEISRFLNDIPQRLVNFQSSDLCSEDSWDNDDDWDD
ncbi:UvrD-helicase domain-containing protein [Patescibacteria group bacterium]|nr:UvrD-helicase domain-containing protein [Patescibacteria group bacterium]